MPFVVLPRVFIVPVALSLAFLVVVMWLSAGSLIPVYHVVMLGGVLPLVGWRRAALAAALQRVPLPPFWRLVVLGLCAVVLEESVVGVLHGLQEGAGVGGILRRMGQFILFNLFAFSGLVIGFALLTRRYAVGRYDLLVIGGAWGVFAEGLLARLMSAPLVAGLLLLPTMSVYALILLPAQMSLRAGERGTRASPPVARAVLTLGLIWLLSVPAILAVTSLRAAHPALFPPCAYIACG